MAQIPEEELINHCSRWIIRAKEDVATEDEVDYGFHIGYRRKVLVDSAQETLDALLAMVVPRNCSERIFQYLSKEELRMFADKKNFSNAM